MKHTRITTAILLVVTLFIIALVATRTVDSKRVEIDPYPTHELKVHPSVDTKNPMTSFHSVHDALSRYLPNGLKEEVLRVLYGKPAEDRTSQLPEHLRNHPEFEVKYYSLAKHAAREQLREPRLVKVGAIQNGIIKPTSAPIREQYEAIREKIEKMIDAAGEIGVNVLSMQEIWTSPFFFSTRERLPWMEFAEDAENGPSAQFIRRKAKQWNMVIISSILERDSVHQDTVWNTVAVFGHNGNFIGKHRKNHIPRVGDFNESTYYLEGNTGHPVFETKFGKIAINICYGRHHPLNWMMFGLNGAEIVFNPSATVGHLSEPLWPIEARAAAIFNNYFTIGINRVGIEHFPNEFTSGDGKPAHKDFGPFYGSSYVAGPDGSRTPELSRLRDGLLVAEIDLNQCRQAKDSWGFQNTARHSLYASKLSEYVQHDYKPQIIRDPSLDEE